MATLKWLQKGWLAGSVAAGCLGALAGLAAGGADAESPPQEAGGKYVLDFSGSPNRGVVVGKFNNLGFKLDLQRPTRKISVGTGNQRLPDVVATFDYADCTKGQESLLEQPVRDLGPGEAAWVEYVASTIIPTTQRAVKWTGGVCYGFRDPGGRWHWNLTTTPLTHDASSDRVVTRLTVMRGPIDALKLVFDYSVPPQAVTNVTVTTRPIGSKPDPPYSPQKK